MDFAKFSITDAKRIARVVRQVEGSGGSATAGDRQRRKRAPRTGPGIRVSYAQDSAGVGTFTAHLKFWMQYNSQTPGARTYRLIIDAEYTFQEPASGQALISFMINPRHTGAHDLAETVPIVWYQQSGTATPVGSFTVDREGTTIGMGTHIICSMRLWSAGGLYQVRSSPTELLFPESPKFSFDVNAIADGSVFWSYSQTSNVLHLLNDSFLAVGNRNWDTLTVNTLNGIYICGDYGDWMYEGEIKASVGGPPGTHDWEIVLASCTLDANGWITSFGDWIYRYDPYLTIGIDTVVRFPDNNGTTHTMTFNNGVLTAYATL